MSRHASFALGIVPMVGALLVCLAWASPALAQWDPERIAQSKNDAQQAYEAGDYPEAARAYIELRNLLKASLENGDVPVAYVASLEQALLAISYQLGRSNQLSGNCSGALTVYRELIADVRADRVLHSKARLRWAESELCVASQLEAEGRYPEVAERLSNTRTQLDALRQMASDEPNDELAELLQSSNELEEQQATLQQRAISALLLRAERLLEAKQCDNAAQTMQTAAKHFELGGATLSAWMEAQKHWDDACLSVAPEPPPAVDHSLGLDWIPWTVLGLGGATLVSAVVADVIVSGQLDEYEDMLASCKSGLDERCVDARARYDELSGRPTIVAALYIAGGVLSAGALAYLIIDWLGDADEPISLGVDFGAQGWSSTLRWRF